MADAKNVLVRGLPTSLHRDLKILAALEGITLQGFIIRGLERHVIREKYDSK